MQTIKSRLDTGSESYQRNREEMLEMLAYVDELFVEVTEGGGEEAMERLRLRGKMPVRQRIALVLDRDSPFMEISPLAGWNSGVAVGGGLPIGIGIISDVECLILGNDPSVRAGAYNAFSSKKIMRGLEIARENRIPYVQFVESAGGDLRGNPSGGGGGGGGGGPAKPRDPRKPAQRSGPGHFAESGRMY